MGEPRSDKPAKALVPEEKLATPAVAAPAKMDVETKPKSKQLELDEEEIGEDIEEEVAEEVEEDIQEELSLDDEDDDVDYLEKSEDLLDDGDDYRTH